MAPWPEQGNELKSIDKVNEIRSSSFDETQHQSKSDHLDDKGKTAKAEDSQDPQVLCLDEGQLKALLDEAITYKNPKDREGKSELFKELLQEVEADDKSTPGAGAGAQGANAKNPIHSATSNARFNRNHRRTNQALNSSGRHISERNRSGGSLQNLVQAYASELEAGGGYSRRRGAGGGGGGGSGRGNTLRGSGINVSARQREGGSLPSNVNHVQGVSGASASLFDEYKRTRDVIMPPTEDKVSSESGLCTDYSSSTNTHSRKTSSTWGDEEGIELEEMRGGGGARTYTSRATLEVCTDPAREDDVNGACGAPGTVDVDSSVLFPLKSKCSPTPFTASLSSGGDSESHAASSNSTSPSTYNYVRLSDLEYCTSSLLSSSTTRNESSGNVISTLSIPPQPISLGASGASQAEDRSSSQQSAAEFLVNSPQVSMLLAARDYHTLTPIPHGFHLSEPLHAYTSSGYISSLDKCKSGYDENGNTVSQSDRKKPRRHKAKNEKNTYLAETVDGFRGTLDLHELLQFIENEPGGKKKAKMTQQRKKTKDDSEQPKKRKGKDKLTKCNSLEEISKTKLEDLTSTPCQNQRLRPKKQVTLDDEELGWHRREEDANSVSADEALVGRKRKQEGRGAPAKERGPEGEEEFRLVQTKKHRRRKRRSSHNEQNQPDVFRTARSSPERRGARHRTSSMPPSDRSDCSDLDSVHSLPVTSQHGRHRDHSLADANHSLDGTEQANHSLDGTEQENHSPGGTGKASRQRVTSSPSGTAHTRSNSCTFGTIPSSCSVATDTSGAKLTKAVSCHSSSMCVNETGLGGRSLTKSTPNSTLHLAGTSSHPQPAEPGRASTGAAPSGTHGAGNPSKSNAGAKPTSPERRRKISGGPPPSQPPEDFSSRPWAEGDYPPLPANPAHPPPASSRSDTAHSQRSSAQTLVNGLANEEDIRNPERRRSHGPTSSGTEPIVCNGETRSAGLTGEETVETVTLSLKKNSNKHRAPSPASGGSTTVNNNNNCCDVYVEFNLPAPPPPPPVDVTVEKTVIIRSQSCTVVSESVSLVIPPPPPSSRKSSRNNHPAAGTLATTSLPPVILRDSRVHRSKKLDVSSTSRPSDLTFGFEINPSLLLTQGRSSEPPAGGKGDVCPAHHHHPSQRAQDREQRLLAECFNYTDIVNFIGNAWKDVMKELTNQKSSSSNRVDYYSHQASTPSS